MRNIAAALAVSALLVIAGLAGSASASTAARTAAAHRVTVHSLMVAIVRGETVSIDGVTYAAHPVAKVSEPRCGRQLAVIGKVAQQGGIGVGSGKTQAITATGPKTWARELRSVRLPDLAAAALGIHDGRSDADYVMALQATAVTILQGGGNCVR